MKTYTKPTTSKIVTRFDNELKNILMEDLKAFMSKTNFTSNKRITARQTLAVA